MRFSDWRKQQGKTQQQCADELGVSQPVISDLEADEPKIRGRDFVLRVFRMTRGGVTPNDLYALPSIDQLELDMTVPGDAPLLASAGDQ